MTGTSEPSILAVDIGGTKIALAVVRNGKIAVRRQLATPRSGRGVDIVAAIVAEAAAMPSFEKIGIATTGIVEAGRLTALNPATLPIEDHFPLAEELAARFGRAVLAVNDAQAAGWAEYRIGAGRSARRLAFVTVSTGIGGGIVLDGILQVGSRGLAGHVGHMIVDPRGPLCGCGRRGCVERLASGTAIAEIGTHELGRPVSAPDVFAAAGDGSDIACRVLDEAAISLTATFVDLTASLDLDLFIVGGGVGLAPGFIGRVRAAMDSQPAIFQRTVVAASLGADAGLIGAALLV